MSFWDWFVVAAFLLCLYVMCMICKRYMKGVSDFLVAGRNVGKYLGMTSGSMAGLGAITILAMWQMSYKSGFVGTFLWTFQYPFSILLALSGFAIYRFRQTRAMTIPQLLEMRYSKSLRVFCGLLTYVSGVLNMGIFPAVGANFVLYFCGFPTQLHFLGLTIPTVLIIMLLLVGVSVLICFTGGQVTLIITDFIQGVFVNLMLLVFVVLVFRMISWDQFSEVYLSLSANESMINPFTKGQSEFDARFFLIQMFWMMYLVVAWSPDTMQVSSAKDAREAFLMKGLVQFKYLAGASLGLFVLPLAAFVIMNHSDFSDMAANVNNVLASITNPSVRSQLIVPSAVANFLPVGLLGAFLSVVLFAFISTHDTYMLAWGGVLIQDVVMPLKKKKLTPRQHLVLLRSSVIFVAAIIITFSMNFEMTDNILMFQALTGSIYTAGAGVVIIGALYWKKATVSAAWSAIITGTSLALIGFIYRYKINTEFPMNGTYIAFYSSLISSIVFVAVSLFTNKGESFDLDKMLHREEGKVEQEKIKWWQFTKGFSLHDKIVFWVLLGYVAVYSLVPLVLFVLYKAYDFSGLDWMLFWKIYMIAMFISGVLFVCWITIGGFRDMFAMFRFCRQQAVDDSDDGSVGSK
ncbi:MAG: sodium:solute symporter [Sedimentisphaeraceae bacterium JB056]